NTTSALSTIAPTLTLLQTVQVAVRAQAVTVPAESSGSAFSLQLLDPLGNAVASVSSSGGVAVIEQPVTLTGLYSVKVVNGGVKPAEVWLLATPWGARCELE